IQFPSRPIHIAIVRLLSDFAEGDRYSNINFLVGATRQADPMAAWFTQVDLPLLESDVSEKRKLRIVGNARTIAQLASSVTHVLHTSETGSEITDVGEASYRTGVVAAVAPYRQLCVLQIIRFWSDLVSELGHLAQALGREDIPYFAELFGAFRS